MSAPNPRTQAERTAQTKARLIDAAVECLVEHGYAHTTTVEICARAELTRGAYNHHYKGPQELFLDVLEELYERLAASPTDTPPESLEDVIRGGWSKVKRPEFKAVIELWLASRNDPDLGTALASAIARLSRVFEPGVNPKLGKLFATDPELVSLYRVAFESMIGLALGRATTPAGAAVEHENQVLDTLISLARDRERQALAKVG